MIDCAGPEDQQTRKLDQAQRDAYTVLVIFLVVFVLCVWLVGASVPPSKNFVASLG